jgi:cytochrome c554/c'-like protein
MAAVVDLQTVAASPDRAVALLPPYRTMVEQVSASEPSPGPARQSSPQASLKGRGNGAQDWLVDPNEWYTPEERERRGPDNTEDADAKPRETTGAPADEPPVSTEWKLLTPDDMAQPAAQQSAPQDKLAPSSEPASPSTAPIEGTNEQPVAVEPVPAAESQPASPPVDALEPDTAPLRPAPALDVSLPPADAKQSVDGRPTGRPLFDAPYDSESRTTSPIAPPPFPSDEPLPAPPQQEASPPTDATQSVSDGPQVDPLFDAPYDSESRTTLPAPPRLPANKPLPAPPHEETSPAEEIPPPGIEDSASSNEHPASSIENPASGIEGPPPAQIFPAPTTLQATDPHIELFAKNMYPSARECATCHEDIYHEWSVSAHAYAAVSPMFHKFEQKLNDLTHGTVGYFCMRCHAPVATALCASRAEPLWNLPEVAREGITCIACHRVQYVYGKSNGERRIEPGDVFTPVMGGIGGEGVAETIHRREHFKVKTSPNEAGPGQNMHAAGIYFEPLTRSEFCTPCHQVAVHPGIKLEVVWEQYRASPACKKGIQCQDCHMGRVPGVPLGYNVGPAAKIADKTVNDQRKRSNHIFFGPNYSIAHPGVFPFHLKANRWSMQDWLAFDWRAGWGTDEFENRVADGAIQVEFPPVWAEADDRNDAREIIEENLAKLNRKRELRVEVMENGSRVEGPFFDSPLCRGQDVRFHYIVTNTNEGHNLLTASLGAQPQYWANVALIGPDGRRLWETGYTDSCGDLANIHSIDVRHKRLPFDWQLFNLQTMFLITGAKGTDREFPVPVNVDIDQLPFIRPGAQPITTINHPPFIRMESQSLAPLGSRRVPYRIPGHLVQQPGTYRLSFRMRSRAEPIYFMRFCDATPEMERAMNEWMIDVHPMSVEFVVR